MKRSACRLALCASALLVAAAAQITLVACTARPVAAPVTATDHRFPAPSAVAKQTSAVDLRLLPGSEYLDTSPGYSQRLYPEELAQQVVFDAQYLPDGSTGADGLAYGIYQFNILDHGCTPVLNWSWTGAEPTGNEFWIGLPNRGRDAWEWHAAGSLDSLAVTDWADYLDGDELLVLLVVAAMGEFRLDWVKVGPEVLLRQELVELEFGVNWTSTAIVSERPAIAYVDSFENSVYYVQATDAHGFNWGNPVLVATATFDRCSLAVVAGRPAVVLGRGNYLAYIRATDSTGANWGEAVNITTVDSTSDYGSLAVVAGKPAACSQNQFSNRVLYTRAADATGSAWDASVYPHPEEYDVGAYTTLAVVDGHPAIAYIGEGWNAAIWFVRASDAEGNTWNAPVQVAYGFLPESACLAVINGHPAISYKADAAINYVIAQDPQGLSWSAPITFEQAGGTSYKTSLTQIGGVPAIAYNTLLPYVLYFVKANDAYGSTWSTPRVIDNEEKAGYYPTLFEVRGHPAFAYGTDVNMGERALKYAIIFE